MVEIFIRRYHTSILFAVIDKARGDAFAGVIALINTSSSNLRLRSLSLSAWDLKRSA
jgi:hypothetical protein